MRLPAHTRALVAGLLLCGCTVGDMKIDNPINNIQGDLKRQGQNLSGNKQCSELDLHRYELTAEDEYWFGRSVAEHMLASYVPDRIYDPDSPQAIYLNQVGQAVVAGALTQRDEGGGVMHAPRRFPNRARVNDVPDRPMPPYGYHFILVKDPAPIAFGLPGGFVLVSDGAVSRAADEDQLAGILAHEVAHVQRGHGTRMVQQRLCAQEDSFLTQTGKAVKNTAGQVSSAASQVQLHLPADKAVKFIDEGAQFLQDKFTKDGYGPQYEDEADAYGARYAQAVGYSALGLADYLRRVDADPAFTANAGPNHKRPALRAEAIEKLASVEPYDPAHSNHEKDRAPRFVAALAPSR